MASCAGMRRHVAGSTRLLQPSRLGFLTAFVIRPRPTPIRVGVPVDARRVAVEMEQRPAVFTRPLARLVLRVNEVVHHGRVVCSRSDVNSDRGWRRGRGRRLFRFRLTGVVEDVPLLCSSPKILV
eukprot:SAG25_NODE_8_length_29132_cov_108.213895_24_plen_125_part_00